MTVRERIEQAELKLLAPEAAFAVRSKGRQIMEEPHPYRTAFMRDRDRILHTKAFRRLAYKTQVFVAPQGDHQRVRLTHTLEVTQIARTIARALRLNEDLTEAICLGHDLGHTPFGHLGEEILSEFLGRPFKHNQQSLRIVDRLETRPGGPGPGLNLTWEVRDGILNHTWSMPPPATREAEIARFADRIAYLSHDIDDAITAGVIDIADLPESANRVLGTTAPSRIEAMVAAVVESGLLDGHVSMAPEVQGVMGETRAFMFERVYNRPEMVIEQQRLRDVLFDVLSHYRANPGQIPPGRDEVDDETRLIDYVAGMTDRFVLRLWEN
ncbi:MAG: deoxyguanosinetriphosphate triphosphohydrolase, partial [Actinomycetota bacterium]